MSKNKKPRPVWLCPKCGMRWVSCEPVCLLCGVYGKAMNEGAEKILRKAVRGCEYADMVKQAE